MDDELYIKDQAKRMIDQSTPQELEQVAQKVIPALTSSPGNPMEAQYIQTPEEAAAPQKLSNRELIDKYLMAAQDPSLAKKAEGNIPGWFDWLKYTPRGGRIHGMLASGNIDAANKAKGQIASNMEMAKFYQAQEGVDINKSQESRAAQEHGQKQEAFAASGLKDSPSAIVARNMLMKLSPDQQEQLAKMSERDLAGASQLVKDVYSLNNQRLEAAARLGETQSQNRFNQANANRSFEFQTDPMKSVEGKKRYDLAAQYLKAVGDMKTALAGDVNTFSVIGDNPYTEASRRAAEYFGRLQSGGAINKEEEKKFNKMAPGFTDSSDIQQLKLKNAFEAGGSFLKTMGVSNDEILKMIPQDGEMVTINTPKGKKIVPKIDVQKYLDGGATLVE
jgi:hypothetical protein